MSENIRSLAEEYHAFYEVSPYYVLVEHSEGNSPPTTRRIQAGFDVDVYGVKTENNTVTMPAPEKYALGYDGLRKVAEEVSQHTTDSCSLEVMEFPDTAFIDVRGHDRVEAMLRIRISHFRGLDQPSGLPEERALEEVEKQLKSVNIPRRS